MLSIKGARVRLAEDDRISGLADRVCRAMLDGGESRRPPMRDMLPALTLAIARCIAIAMRGDDRRHQLAVAEAMLRQLGRGLLSASYDRAALEGMFGRSVAAEDQQPGTPEPRITQSIN